VGFARHLTEQSLVSSDNQLINIEGCVTQAAFEIFMEEGINPGFVTLRQLTCKGWECIGDNRLNNRSED